MGNILEFPNPYSGAADTAASTHAEDAVDTGSGVGVFAPGNAAPASGTGEEPRKTLKAKLTNWRSIAYDTTSGRRSAENPEQRNKRINKEFENHSKL